MTNDEMAARIIVLESFAIAAMHSVFALSRGDEATRIKASMLKHVTGAVKFRAKAMGLSESAVAEAGDYADFLTSYLSESLSSQRPPEQEPQ